MLYALISNFFIVLFIGDPLLLKNSYFVSLFFLLIGLLLSCVMVLIPYFFSGRSIKPVEKISEYGCGFEPFDSVISQPLIIHFYIVGILFFVLNFNIFSLENLTTLTCFWPYIVFFF